MFKNLKAETLDILSHVEENAGATHTSIVAATGLKPEIVSASLYTLHHGRYLKRFKSDTKSKHGMQLWAYSVKSLHPRMKKRVMGNGAAKTVWNKVKVKPTFDMEKYLERHTQPKEQESEVELMIAVKGTKETTVLTVKQARDLMEQLKQLGM